MSEEMPPVFAEATANPPDARGRFGAYGGRFVPDGNRRPA